MTVAERMRKYRARKALVAALERAERNGVNVAAVLAARGYHKELDAAQLAKLPADVEAIRLTSTSLP